MTLWSKPLELVTEADFAAAVAAGARESSTRDYKRAWIALDNDSAKRELLLDIASFANSGGGHLIYGIEEANGEPKKILGLEPMDADAETLRIEQLLQTWTDHRIVGVQYQWVKLASGRGIFVIRVPNLSFRLHGVTIGGSTRYVSRNAAGKYYLNTRQIEDIVLSGEKALDRIERFREERDQKISRGQTPTPLTLPYRQVLYVLPLSEQSGVSVRAALAHSSGLAPMGEFNSLDSTAAAEGAMKICTYKDKTVYAYSLLHRTGALEAVRCSSGGQPGTYISPGYEPMVRAALKSYVGDLQRLSVVRPYLIGVSHVNVTGFTIYEEPGVSISFTYPQRPITSEILASPLVLLESTNDTAIDAALKESFDFIWQAVGRNGSPNFDFAGKWCGP